MKGRYRAVALAAATLLAACSGGGHATPAPGAAKASGTGELAFSIVIPKAATSTSTARRPAYVSPSTQSVAFQIGSSAPQVVALTPGSAACPSSGPGYTCTVDLSVPAGNGETLSVTTYASTNGSGTALSQNTLVVNIVADQNNPVNVTLNGVAASLGLNAAPASVTEGTASTVNVTWSAQDANGNTIVGPGSIVNSTGTVITPALSSSDPSDFSVGALAGSTWPVSYDGAVTTQVTFTVNGGGLTAAGTTASINTIPQRLFIANAGATNNVQVLDSPYTGAATAITNSISGGTVPFYVAVNKQFDVFVPNQSNNNVTVYAPPYSGAPIATISVTSPNDVALDSNGNAFISSGAAAVYEYAPPYTGAPVATITTDVGSPIALALDGSNNLYIQNDLNDEVVIDVPPYTGTPTVIASPGCPPGPCFEQVGEQMATLPGTNDLVMLNDAYPTLIYDPPYTAASQQLNSGADDGSWGIAVDASRDIFIAFTATNAVLEYAPPYTSVTATITSAINGPRGISVDRSGNLFVANYGNGTVTQYAPPYTSVPVATITSPGGTRAYSTALSP
jgi:hypothetical protein